MTQTRSTTNLAADLSTPRSDDLVIKCAQLTKVFRDFWLRSRVRAVDQVDLEVHQGQVFGLLGPNGSGKSTTIKLILGLLHPTAGRIAVFGRRPDDVAIKKRIGYLPEETYLYRFLNARETLDYYGRLFHQNRRQRQMRIDMLLEMIGLEAVQRRPVGEYSKGMQRRIGLAQALINDPDLLILDEPTTGLDPVGTRQMKDLIVQLGRRGKTILLCSHLLSDVEDVCDHVSIMFGGKVREEGTVEQLLTRSDRTTIETETLDDQTIQQIESLLERGGRHIEKVEHPRLKLEALFLDIVEKARAEGVATSGARSGGRMAEFLVAGPAAAEGEALIDELVQGREDQQATPPGEQPPAETAQADREQPDERVMEQLSGRPPAAPPPPAPPPSEPEQPAVDDTVLDSLLAPEDDRPSRDQPSADTPAPRRAAEDNTEAPQHDADAPSPDAVDALLEHDKQAAPAPPEVSAETPPEVSPKASEDTTQSHDEPADGGDTDEAPGLPLDEAQQLAEIADDPEKRPPPPPPDEDSERPDQSFIDALKNVPPPEETPDRPDDSPGDDAPSSRR